MNGFQYPSLEIQVRSAEARISGTLRSPAGDLSESLAATASQVSTDLFKGNRLPNRDRGEPLY